MMSSNRLVMMTLISELAFMQAAAVISMKQDWLLGKKLSTGKEVGWLEFSRTFILLEYICFNMSKLCK